jgi:hypothetical protein
MNTRHAGLQPQDPFAAKLGHYAIRLGVVFVVALVCSSFFGH